MKIRIGTRGSKLALWQANLVKSVLSSGEMEVVLKEYKTEGDLVTDKPLETAGEAGLFTRALDDALLNGEIDLAVHSSKDIPTRFSEKLCIAAFLEREDPRDVLLAADESADLDNLSRTLVIGTSSPRRRAFLKHYSPHCEVKDIRGNVDTRVSKMQAGEYDAIILAAAGVKRMGLSRFVVRKLNPSTFTPAPGQGAIAVMCRADYQGLERVRNLLNHAPSEKQVLAEREFLIAMGGGCSQPIFALATSVGNTLSLGGGVAAPDGSAICRETVDGPVADPKALGRQLAHIIIEQGGNDILYGQVQKN